MEKFIFVLSIFCISSLTYAQDSLRKHEIVLKDGVFTSEEKPVQPIQQMDFSLKQELCVSVSKFARRVFNARQRGVPAAEIYKTTNVDDENVSRSMQTITRYAFQYPIGLSGKELDKHSLEFANRIFIECIDS